MRDNNLSKQTVTDAPIAAIPSQLSRPPEGARVLFWTQSRLCPEQTSRDNALHGCFKKGVFWVDTDHWSCHEVEYWAPA